MKLYKYIFPVLLVLSSGLSGQSLKGLQENQVIKNYRAEHPYRTKAAKSNLLLTLPFFEDFSTSAVFPDPGKWTDQYVFINNSFAIDPVSIGVATLDAIDQYGNVYALTNQPTSSDTLTSQDFDLSIYKTTGDRVTFSFFFQCGGKGEVPDPGDDLLLEFYSPKDNAWTVAWDTTLNYVTAFEQVILKVDTAFYQQGFRFRFRNYTSISVNDVSGGEGALSNADCWNIDYIVMNTDPVAAHRSFNDITIIDIPKKLLDFYEAVPWLHLNNAANIALNVINWDFRSLFPKGSPDLVIGYGYKFRNLNIGLTETYGPDFYPFGPDSLYRRIADFDGPLVRNDNSPEGRFEISTFLDTDANQYKPNDTSRIVLDFKDSYVYDDGTPEYGFGIEGPSMTGALLALKFRIYKADTLRSVDMLFNKARNYFNKDLKFQVCVWKDDNGKPGDLLYMSPSEDSPQLDKALPQFKHYPFNSDIGLFVSDTVIYVGWKQNTDQFLNLGYDVNRDNLDKTFINVGNVGGDWINPGGSLIPGTVMIRTVFGDKGVITSSGEIPVLPDAGLVLYPNPADEFINFRTNDIVIRQVTLIDITGRVVLSEELSENRVNISRLTPGIYQAIIRTGNNLTFHRKFVISR